MSQYPSMPPPGPYIAPNQASPAQQQGSQQPSPYPSTPNHVAPNHAHKSGATFGQMMNQRLEQAVTTGKPMLNKLGKTISSKLGNKPLPGPPQHLQSYQNYQTHQGHQGHQSHHGQQSPAEGYQQTQNQTFSPQAQQQQWTQPQHQPTLQAPNVHGSPQQSPYQQSNYATPASGHSGQSNYFPQQTNQAPNSQSYPPQPLTIPGYGTNQNSHGGNVLEQTQAVQGHFGQGQVIQGQPQAPYQHRQQQPNQYPGQQMGVVGSSHGPPTTQSPHISAPPVQSQWGHSGTEQIPSPATHKQPAMPANIPQAHHSAPSPPAQQVQQQQQPCNGTSPTSPHNKIQMQMHSPSNSPSPAQQLNAAPLNPSKTPAQSMQLSTPASQHAAPQPAPTEFVAELPADMGSLRLVESRIQRPDPSTANSQYRAFQPPGSQKASPTPSFTIPRRSLSASISPLADPWRFADPVTEVPTREFYILADLIFDALDRKFDPKNTGLLEAPKIIGSWVKLTEEATRIFSYRNYYAFAKLWSLEGIPHIMVPCQPVLTPNWNFSQHHALELKVIADPPTPMSTYATYMPALNRAGWYKFFFLEIMTEDIGDLISVLCGDTYKPGVLNHPDMSKRDKTALPALQARAAEIQTYAIGRVCAETKTAMAVDSDVPLAHIHPTIPAAVT